MFRHSRIGPVALLGLGLLLAPAALAQIELTEGTCQTSSRYFEGPPEPTVPNGHIAWPADAPLWEFDLYRPANRTSLNGGGLELRDVFYRGRLVFARASVPVLNVEYDEGGCGCFRDWQDEEALIDVGADAVLTLPCLAQAQPGAVQTACEANGPANPTPGGDVGDFTGVSVEDYGDELVLTGHMQAGWYRYRMKWHLYADGRIWPEFSFAAADAICTQTGHRHHAYWRFDFDLDGTPDNDVIREHPTPGSTGLRFTTEASRLLAGAADPTYFSIVDADTGIGYEIHPGEEDRRLPADVFSKTDVLVLRYKMDEIDDGQTVSTGCAFEFEPFVDAESIENEDTVFWIRSGALHSEGQPYECDIVGPMLRPIGFNVSTVPGVVGVEFESARPNPFQGATTSRFRVETTQPVRAELYDLAGRRVQILFDGIAPRGEWQTIRIDGRELPAGTYVVRLRGETARGTTRVVLVR